MNTTNMIALNIAQRKRVMMKQSLDIRKLSGGEVSTMFASLLNRNATRKFNANNTGALNATDLPYTAFI